MVLSYELRKQTPYRSRGRSNFQPPHMVKVHKNRKTGELLGELTKT